MTCLSAILCGLLAIGGTSAYAQVAPVHIEHRNASGSVIEAAAGAGVTLVFRIVNPATTAQHLIPHVELPSGWQVLFASNLLNVPAQGWVIETITISAPRNIAAGDYRIRYETRVTSADTAVTSAVTVRIAERRQLALSWLSAPSFLPSGESGTFALLLTNQGNLREAITLDVRSSLGVPLRSSWTAGSLDAGESRRVQIVRQPDRLRQSAHETLMATATAPGMPAVVEANLGFDVVPEGRGPDPPRHRLPAALSIRTGSGRKTGFGSFVGSGPLNASRTTNIDFGFVSRDRSHPLMFERDRNYASITAPGMSLAAGDQTWSLSYLTESGHYGLGAGGRIDRGRWSTGAFVDTGRHDVTEGSQAGAFLGLGNGRAVNISAQYLARFANDLRSDRIADIGSVRAVLKPTAAISGDFEAGVGQSAAGTGRAISGTVSFDSNRISLYGRRVRKDHLYPIRDRTGLIDGAGLYLRMIGRLQFEGTLDGTGQIEDPTLPIDAPTRQRMTRARLAWGSLASVTASRSEWTSPGRNWSAQWRRESVTAELRIPTRTMWFTPGIEKGTEATPTFRETPYLLSWLQAGIRMGRRNTADIRIEYGRGEAGNAKQIVRRIAFGFALQPIAATRLTMRVSNGGRDALWLQGTQTMMATLDQRLPWRHHVVVNYQRRSGGSAFFDNAEAWRMDYVIPIGIPVHAASESGRITVRVRDGENGQPLARMMVEIKGQARLTDRDGVVAFTGLKPGDYHVTVSPDSVGPGRTVVFSLPPRVHVKGGDRIEAGVSVIRTGAVTGAIQIFQSATRGAPLAGQKPDPVSAAGIANALIELMVNDEYRTTVTDAEGRFTFGDVPPGSWRVRVVRAGIPPFYLLEEAQLTVTVTPAGTSHVVFRVIPKSQ